MAERRSFRDIVFGQRRFRDDRTGYKRSTGFNFFRDDPNDLVYGNSSYILGYNSSAGDFDMSGLGNGQSNSAVTACLQVLGVSFSEATLQVMFVDEDGQSQTIPNHPFANLLRRPNPYMSGDVVQQYIINAMHVSGDAYLMKQKNNAGELVALYPIMPEQVIPKGTVNDLITHYEYQVDKGTMEIKPQDMVHIRLGLDPSNHKKGFSPLKTVLREIYGDESAGQMATALLANSGVPSMLITPKDDYGLTETEADQISRTYQQKVGGKNKGKPLILSGSMNVERLAFSPKDLDIGALRRIPEERVSAVLGVPAILAGLGAGLERATYNNTSELREFFTEQKLIPLWRMVAEELTQQVLLPDYQSNQAVSAEYDFSEVRALQGDEKEMFEKLNVGVQGGWITVAEARKQVGLPTNESQDVYLLSNSVIPTPADMEQPEQEEEPEAPEPEQVVTEDMEENQEKGIKRFEDKVVRRIDNQFCVIAEESGRNMGCYPTRELAEARLEQISRFSNNPKAMVGVDEFTTIEEAQERAEEIGCSGTHQHDKDGNVIYMPCSTHEEYEQRLSDYNGSD
jgi:HK97 family phage portal protein